MTVVKFPPTEPRASELARCPRMCALRGLGTPAKPPSQEAEWFFHRGKMYEDYAYDRWCRLYGPENVVVQPPIEWPHGVGHADFYIPPENLLIEVKSTTAPRATLATAARQLKIYMRFHPASPRGALFMLNPSSLRPDSEREYSIVLTPDDVEEIDAAVAAVGEALAGGVLPDRVCAQPSDALGRFCQFADPCFDGWEPEPLNELDPGLADLVRQLWATKQIERQTKADAQARTLDRKALEEQLADAGVPAGRHMVAGYRLSRTVVEGHDKFDLAAARLAAVPEDVLAPFVSRTSGHQRWDVRRTEAAVDADTPDADEEAPF